MAVMARQRHLNNAPIIEAIIDFRTRLPATFDATRFSSLKAELSDGYPQMEESRAFEAGVKIKGKQVQQILEDKGLRGYRFESQDGKNVAQFRQDGFTFSRLKPYTNWQGVLGEAKRLWKLYVDRAFPDLIVRITVRYINQLNVPLPIDDFAQYLTAPPVIPKNLPQDVSDFLTRVTICDRRLDIKAHIIQALEKSSKPDNVTIILDIDVFKQKESGFDELEMWQAFEQFRDLKNRIFFGSITEETARLFE
ncbi:MAG: hypothetical protein COT13_05545 [Chloroflexi bacterium CG08_land_8_20_14_0_20_45_12]|nr:MAG: hypothetical protein COT13_05545 [Chloroflexi bacterium CG08_land_8_20_14_0_20_45_12]